MTNDTTDEPDSREQSQETPGQGISPDARPIEPAAPAEFGFVQAWWGDGKREDDGGDGNGISGGRTRLPGPHAPVHERRCVERRGDPRGVQRHCGNGRLHLREQRSLWLARLPRRVGRRRARCESPRCTERVRELLAAANDADLQSPLPHDGLPEDGMHILILDEILYAANRGLVEPSVVVEFIETKSDGLELVLTGGHENPDYIDDHADLVTNVRKGKHPFDAGHRARKGTEY